MTTAVDLVNGLGGAIGCDYRSRPDQLDFVEFNGRVSRLNMIGPLISIVSQGTTILKGTWIVDCETGALGGRMKYGIPVPVTAMCGFSDGTIVKPPVLPQR
jgi:hypothetical protein